MTAAGGLAIVTDGEQRAALAAVRSLGAAGWRVLVCASRAKSLAGASRFAERSYVLPDPLATPGPFGEALATLTRDTSADLLLPITDAALLAVLGDRERFAPAAIPFPSLEAFRSISDKAALLAEADALGIAIPAQHSVSCAEEIERLMPELKFPLVLKPARSIGEVHGHREKVGVQHADSPEALRELSHRLTPSAYPLLLQQRVVGPGVGIFLLVWNGQIVARFAHRRLREKPPSGGVSVYRESISADPTLSALSADLLARFQWQGPAMIEYKVDSSTGTPYLMEINGRLWGSLQLAIDAGVDFPVLLARLAMGKPVDGLPKYEVGVRSRWWWGDVDHLLARLTRSRRRLALPPDAPSRARALLEFLRVGRKGDRNEVLRFTDPRPALRESIDWLRRR